MNKVIIIATVFTVIIYLVAMHFNFSNLIRERNENER